MVVATCISDDIGLVSMHGTGSVYFSSVVFIQFHSLTQLVLAWSLQGLLLVIQLKLMLWDKRWRQTHSTV